MMRLIREATEKVLRGNLSPLNCIQPQCSRLHLTCTNQWIDTFLVNKSKIYLCVNNHVGLRVCCLMATLNGQVQPIKSTNCITSASLFSSQKLITFKTFQYLQIWSLWWTDKLCQKQTVVKCWVWLSETRKDMFEAEANVREKQMPS